MSRILQNLREIIFPLKKFPEMMSRSSLKSSIKLKGQTSTGFPLKLNGNTLAEQVRQPDIPSGMMIRNLVITRGIVVMRLMKNWIKIKIIEAKTHPVGRKKPNPWGLYDMHGNVWEWCQDIYHSNYNDAPSDGSAWEDAGSNIRVSQGGSWIDFTRGCRSAVLRGVVSSSRYDYLGFRVLREI
jgi:hypothetical protein